MQKDIGTIDLNDILSDSAELSPATYQYYRGLQNRRIIINDDIMPDILESAILPLIEMDNDGSGKEIEIILCSGGGDVYSGFALVDVIEKLKTPTTIKIFGMAASMACLIAMSHALNDNVKTICSKFSVGLIHGGSQYLQGSTHQVRDTYKFSERYEERIKDYILSHTKISEEMYRDIERQEFWMDSDDMLKYGVVSEIV